MKFISLLSMVESFHSLTEDELKQYLTYFEIELKPSEWEDLLLLGDVNKCI